ncbi:hypothetical protein KQ876_00610 [Mycoplasma sp. CSL7491-lung]|uniref:hypothetical protein n=1 Tax=Mycoplasma sp. CSL7491-lung TaxID=549718 RepID=UPI001C0F64A5|nr:hypothetical protein [Mycoplasma sp. CSL7491-lung]MBU4692709.1 hypothetical protein [Mycoplasma sp. CSL7491-lung]
MKKYNFNDFKILSKEEFEDNFNKLKEEYNNQLNKKTFYSNILLFALIIHSFNSQIRFNSKNEFNIPSGKQTLN